MATKTIADKSITVRADGGKIPFDMVTNEYLNDRIILAKLAEVENAPDTKWLTRDEVFSPIRERFGYEA